MLELLNKKYEELKLDIKYNKNGEYDGEINNKIISLYCSILGYYSAKLDLEVNKDNIERLKDKINLESYDKKLINILNLDNYLDFLISPNAESKRANFYDTLYYFKISSRFNNKTIETLKNDFDDAYLKTLLNKNQKKLDSKNQNKIYKTHKKSYKLVNRYTKK